MKKSIWTAAVAVLAVGLIAFAVVKVLKPSTPKLDIDNGWNNRGTKWSVHIDNDACETIGYADIDTIEQFNKLMEIFDSKFRL